ncbi:hypothetical protein [Pseudaminobacter soli (ex Li et al. 2025)]|uniref:Head decoration protein n=1 Tax=Pseudaminobacter soli (ex Li et al. 2025) TaxID=1295366 RepID=A0A2P7SE05_9HYPH|nr:hypothetical protein [Mesorhizobium soli]PSJ60742.1 hypothetical protein C7I85_11915 [Mesorhizobium soli]
MAYLHDRVLDNGLTVLTTETKAVHFCSAQPATYAEATTTLSLGSKATPTVGSPSARLPNGRKVTVAAISDANATAAGIISHYALVDTTNSRLLAAGSLLAAKSVTSGDKITSAAFDIGIPGPA